MSNIVDREKLLKVLNMVKPAVATKDYIPILNNFLFEDGAVTAYNDIIAINSACDVTINFCVSADLLIKALNSFKSETVEFYREGERGVMLKSGKSKINLPELPVDSFPEFITKTKLLGKFTASKEMLTGISRCLLATGNDANHPEQQGITLDPFYSETEAALYSTDNATISRYTFVTDDEQHDPLILPTVFCEQLLAISKTLKVEAEVGIYAGCLIARFAREGKSAVLFGKRLVDTAPMSFTEIVDKYINKKLVLHDMPETFAECFERALMVQQANIPNISLVTVDNGKIKIESATSIGEAVDEIYFDGEEVQFSIDPSLVKRTVDMADKIAMLRTVFVLAGDNYLHLISHCSE